MSNKPHDPSVRALRLGSALCLFLSLSLPLVFARHVTAEGVTYSTYAAELRGLNEPTGVAVASDGSIYVADSGNHRVRVFERSGRSIRVVGKRGSGEGELLYPCGVAVLPDGNLVVADTGNHRLQILTPDGESVSVVGSRGNRLGEFLEPVDVSVRGDALYVADRGNDRIQILGLDGMARRAIAGELRAPEGVAVAPNHDVFVTDRVRDRVHRFDRRGELVATWGDYGEFPGLLAGPRGIAVAHDVIYVADTDNHRVQIFDPAGNFRGHWGQHTVQPHEGQGKIHYPSRLAISPDGSFAVVCETFEDRCQVFARDETDVVPEADPRLSSLRSAAHYGARCALDGDLLVIAEPESHGVLVFDTRKEGNPIQITTIGRRTAGSGGFLIPGDVAIDGKRDRVYVADPGTRTVQIFALDRDPANLRFDAFMARFIKGVNLTERVRHLEGVRTDHPVVPVAIDRDGKGRLYVLDGGNAQILVLDEKFDLVRCFGSRGTGPGRLQGPSDLALTGDGKGLAVVDRVAGVVQVFDLAGQPRLTLGKPGWTRGSLGEPFSVVGDADGSFFVSESGAHRISVFDAEGRYRASFGRPGIGAGELRKPRGLGFDPRGRLVVIDYGHHRAHVFSKDGEYVHVFGSRFYTQPAKDSLRDPEENT